MASPSPPVALRDHCSIIHDNTLYVYSPEAFQILPLERNATWTQEPNGVTVYGAKCVQGGVDGDSSNPALYIVGGTTNSTLTGYSGIQRYSIRDKKWTTIDPVTPITSNRQRHGATYLNASSSILVYGGSQSGDAGPSTETFLMLMYPPYRVQAYSSVAPAVVDPVLLPWNSDRAVMVGGGSWNRKVFTFHPDPGWEDLGLSLPNALPDLSIAQFALQSLDDGSKVLQTYLLSLSPNLVQRNVLLNPGSQPASYGETVGDTNPSRHKRKRSLYLNNYPIYNDTYALKASRTNAALAIGNGDITAIVGGDPGDSIAVFNTTGNSWLNATSFFADSQQPLTSSSVSSSMTVSTPTASSLPSSTPTTTESVGSGAKGANNGLAILGGVLGGICGLAAILIILLLWLRSVRRKKQAEDKERADSRYPDDKRPGVSHTSGGLQPLSQQAQPMGRSPVPSVVVSEPDSVAMFGARVNEKALEAQAGSHSTPTSRSKGTDQGSISFAAGKFKRDKSPLTISKPILSGLGNHQERLNTDPGKPTTSNVPTVPQSAVIADRKTDQRKTDEGWAKYFQPERTDSLAAGTQSPVSPIMANATPRKSSRPSVSESGGGSLWPGSRVGESSRQANVLRDSAGNTLTKHTVTAASPNLETGSTNPRTRDLCGVEGREAKISSADSVSSVPSEDEYEDDELSAYSSGAPGSVHEMNWTPVGNGYSEPPPRPLRPPSPGLAAFQFPLASTGSRATSDTSGSGASSLPAFPMPNSTGQRARPKNGRRSTTTDSTGDSPTAGHFIPPNHDAAPPLEYHGGPAVPDYFGPGPSTLSEVPHRPPEPAGNTDVSWVNLGTPGRGA